MAVTEGTELPCTPIAWPTETPGVKFLGAEAGDVAWSLRAGILGWNQREGSPCVEPVLIFGLELLVFAALAACPTSEVCLNVCILWRIKKKNNASGVVKCNLIRCWFILFFVPKEVRKTLREYKDLWPKCIMQLIQVNCSYSVANNYHLFHICLKSTQNTAI